MTINRTSLTTSAGCMIDLLAPSVADIDFAVICEHLSKANRYCGATPDTVYSVAEHSVRCADEAMRATGDKTLSAYLLCHDMHEAFLGDDTTPKKRALQSIMQEFGTLAGAVEDAFNLLTYRLDVAIHEAAGLTWPPSSAIQAAIKQWDTILLATEWRDLMRCDPPYDFGVAPIESVLIVPSPWRVARMQMHARCRTLLPKLQSAFARDKDHDRYDNMTDAQIREMTTSFLDPDSKLAHGKTPSQQGGST